MSFSDTSTIPCWLVERSSTCASTCWSPHSDLSKFTSSNLVSVGELLAKVVGAARHWHPQVLHGEVWWQRSWDGQPVRSPHQRCHPETGGETEQDLHVPVHMYFFFFLYNLVKVEYNNIHGGKLSIENLRLYLEMSRGKQAINHFFGNKQATKRPTLLSACFWRGWRGWNCIWCELNECCLEGHTESNSDLKGWVKRQILSVDDEKWRKEPLLELIMIIDCLAR